MKQLKTLRETITHLRFPKNNKRILKENSDFPTNALKDASEKHMENCKISKNPKEKTKYQNNQCFPENLGGGGGVPDSFLKDS